MMSTKAINAPWAWELRSSPWYITFVVAIGGAVDLLVYALPVSFIPFRLQELGYDRTSSKAGWLLFAFSLSLILSTPFVSWWSEKYNSRRNPLIAGLVALIGSQALFMEAKVFWLMILARVLQGISSTVVWVLALALLCDSVPPDQIGRHMGITMMGYSCGLIVAAPLGGLLYGTLGYRAPFIFGMIAALVDLVGRILVIEKSEADAIRASLATQAGQNELSTTQDAESGTIETDRQIPEPTPRLPAWRIWRELGFRRRPVAVFMLTLVYGMVITAIEPSVPLRLRDVWGLSPTKVGLIFLAATAPTILSGPLTGWLSDKYGAPLVAVGCLILAIPWLYPLTLSSKLAIFIVSLLFTMFFESGLVTPITVETAKLTETIPGVGYADTFGVFNIAYGSGSMLGPVIGGQLYDEHQNGWVLTCIVIGGLLAAGIAFAATIGEVPFALTAYRAVVPKAVTPSPEEQELEESRVAAAQ